MTPGLPRPAGLVSQQAPARRPPRPHPLGRTLGHAGAGTLRASVPALAAAALALAGLSLLLPSAPTYDPWSWINWGREVVGLDLDTRGGPAWKPLPVLFTAPFSLFGDAAPYLWIAVARAGGLLALAMAYRLGGRLAGAEAARPVRVLAGLVAAVSLASSSSLVRDVALGSSEGILAALVLWAFERHLDGRPEHALVVGFGVALLRPESWPFFAGYALYVWLREPRRRVLVGGLLALLPVLWLAPELWGSGDLFRSASRAKVLGPESPGLASHPALEVLRQFERILIPPVELAAAVGLTWAVAAFARSRRGGAVLAVGLGGAGWLAVVALMTQAGYPGETRYLVVATAAASVLAGVGVARALGFAREALDALGTGRRLRTAVAVGAGLLVAAAGIALAVPRAKLAPEVARDLGHDARVWQDARTVIARAGGRRRLLACGRPYTGARYVPMLAWELRVRGIRVGLDARPPGVLLQLPARRGERPGPAAAPGFRPLAATGEARLVAACAPGGRGAASPSPRVVSRWLS
jgi:hypothetical protein